jgi:hypothetical protein
MTASVEHTTSDTAAAYEDLPRFDAFDDDEEPMLKPSLHAFPRMRTARGTVPPGAPELSDGTPSTEIVDD